jgi:hypothetical protein
VVTNVMTVFNPYIEVGLSFNRFILLSIVTYRGQVKTCPRVRRYADSCEY